LHEIRINPIVQLSKIITEIARAGPSRCGAPLISVMTSSCSVNRAMTFLMKIIQQNNSTRTNIKKWQIIGHDLHEGYMIAEQFILWGWA